MAPIAIDLADHQNGLTKDQHESLLLVQQYLEIKLPRAIDQQELLPLNRYQPRRDTT